MAEPTPTTPDDTVTTEVAPPVAPEPTPEMPASTDTPPAPSQPPQPTPEAPAEAKPAELPAETTPATPESSPDHTVLAAESRPEPAAPPEAQPLDPPPQTAPPSPSASSDTSSNQPTGGIPPAVLALSDAELRAAATLYLQKHQAEFSHLGVQARQAAMQQNLDAILAYVRKHGRAHLPRLAREINCLPGTTSHYLQILVKQGKLKAEGWAANRRYFIG